MGTSIRLLGAGLLVHVLGCGGSSSGGTGGAQGNAGASGGTGGHSAAGAGGGAAGATGSGGRAAAGAGGGAAGAGGAAAGASAAAGAAGGSPRVYPGSITFEDLELTGAVGDQFGVSAAFGAPLPPAATGCAGGTQMLSCCYQAVGPTGSNAQTQTVSAGDITITDGTTSIGTLMFNSVTVGTTTISGYNPLTVNAPPALWQGADTLTVSAAGATVAAFHGALRAPAAIAGISPDYTAQPRPSADRTQDLVVSWAPDTATGQSMVFATSFIGGNQSTITCTVDDSAGTLTVPAAMLEMFPTGPQTVDVSLTRQIQTTVSAANATVRLAATNVRLGTIVVP